MNDGFTVSNNCLIDIPEDLVNDDDQWDVFPNPFENDITIKSEEDIDYIEFQIYNIAGMLLIGRKEQISFGRFRIPLNHLSQGAYLLKIKTGDSWESHKLIKY